MSTANSDADDLVAEGEFDVKIEVPELIPVPTSASPIGRHVLRKVYDGGLKGQSTGEMLTAGQPQRGEAAYVALESFVGTLAGRAGGFALAHLGTMQAGDNALSIRIAPGSGTGELAGIRGEMLIRREAGKHYYTLTCRITSE